MKKPLLITLLLLSGYAMGYAQCIDSFPYVFDFETFTTLQTTESCDANTVGASASGWTQDANDDGDWRADTAGTVSIGTGPGSTDTTNGIGNAKDYLPGTNTGIYLYTEATVANNACAGSEVNLLSPCFDFSDTNYYRLKFAYHMHGAGMGSLHVDVYSGGKWIEDEWVLNGDQGEGWKIATVGLGNYNDSNVQVRIRAIMGVNFMSDVAIDAVTVETYSPSIYDGQILSSGWASDGGYVMQPKGHRDTVRLSATIKNDGIKEITGVRLKTGLSTSLDSVTLGTMSPGQRDTLTTYHKRVLGDNDTLVSLELVQNEADANNSDNNASMMLYPTDTIYSRDDGTAVGGVGNNNGGIQMGSIYELFTQDTLTSVSMYLNGGTPGDSFKLHLYTVTNNLPDQLVTTSKTYYISGTAGWYHLSFDCDEVLSKGKHFIAVEQLTGNNLSLGYDTKYYTQGAGLYSVGGNWTDFSVSNLFVSLLLRMNLGTPRVPDVKVSIDDSICYNQEYVVTAEGATSFRWEPFGPVQAKVGKTVSVKAVKDFQLRVTGTDQCGNQNVLVKDITVKSLPSLEVIDDTTVCQYQSVLLQAFTGSSYKWVGGPSNMNYGVNPTRTTSYTVQADSSNGCSSKKQVTVTVSIPQAKANNDTILCERQLLPLVATGGTTYQWTGGPASSTYNVYPTTNSRYIVKVTDTYNCSAYDTVNVQMTKGPSLSTSNDTTVCFGNRVLMSASGADAYKWDGGPNTATYNALPISTKAFKVKGTDNNTGCFIIDSVVVTVVRYPSVSIQEDTAICEGESLTLTANTSDQVAYDWSSGQDTKDITVSPKETTTYKVVVSNTTGCSGEDSVTVTVDPLPTIDFSVSQNHKIITISNSSMHVQNHEWIWGDGDTTTSASPVHRYNIHGDYTVTYSVSNKCGTKDTSFDVNVENISVEDILKSVVKAYPIPVADVLNIEAIDEAGITELTLTNSIGQIVYQSEDALTVSQIDMSSMVSGYYSLHIVTDSGQYQLPIIKK